MLRYGYEGDKGDGTVGAPLFCLDDTEGEYDFHGYVKPDELPGKPGKVQRYKAMYYDDGRVNHLTLQEAAWHGAAFLAAPSTAFVNVWFDKQRKPHIALSSRGTWPEEALYRHLPVKPQQLRMPNGEGQFLVSGYYNDASWFQEIVQRWSCCIFTAPQLRDNLIAFGACVSGLRVRDRILPRVIHWVEPHPSELTCEAAMVPDPAMEGDFLGRMANWVRSGKEVVNHMAYQLGFSFFYDRVLSAQEPEGDDFVVLVHSYAASKLKHICPALRKLATHWPTEVPTAPDFFGDREAVRVYICGGHAEKGLSDFMSFANSFGQPIVISRPVDDYNGKLVFYADKAHKGKEVAQHVRPIGPV